MRGQRGTDVAFARHEEESVLGDSGLIHQLGGLKGDQGCLLRRFRHHRIAAQKCGADLSEKNRQREVPGRYADKHAAAAIAVAVLLTCRAWHQPTLAEQRSGLVGIVAAEVNGFADFGDAVGETLSRFHGEDHHQPVAVFLQQIAKAFEACCPFIDRFARPGFEALLRLRDGLACCLRVGEADCPNLRGAIHRRKDRVRLTRRGKPLAERTGVRERCLRPGHAADKCIAFGGTAEFDSLRVAAAVAIKIDRQRDGAIDCMMPVVEDFCRTFQHGFDGNGSIANNRYEGRIGTVFEKTAHKIGQQVLVSADGGVDPGRKAVALAYGLVETFAHAMKALELVTLGRPSGKLDDLRDRQGIVGGKLRVENVPCCKHTLGAAQIGQIGCRLAGENRIPVDTLFLGTLDFRVPVGALDETHHQLATGLAG